MIEVEQEVLFCDRCGAKCWPFKNEHGYYTQPEWVKVSFNVGNGYETRHTCKACYDWLLGEFDTQKDEGRAEDALPQ